MFVVMFVSLCASALMAAVAVGAGAPALAATFVVAGMATGLSLCTITTLWVAIVNKPIWRR
jgi:hypothetical protein